MKNILNVQHIFKQYGARTVVNDVSLTLHGGEIVGLLGANGAGKTTCFYIVCGFIRADRGEIFINRENITALPIDKRAHLGLGYLPQEPSIFRRLSVEDNIMAILELRKDLDKAARIHHLEKLLREFRIEHIRHINGIHLSGGERKRVEIARSIANEPKFILLDEPFAGVDPISVGGIQRIIEHLKTRGIGVLITDHNYREMLDTCDYSYVLHNGRIIAKGDKQKILKHETVRKVYLGEKDAGENNE